MSSTVKIEVAIRECIAKASGEFGPWVAYIGLVALIDHLVSVQVFVFNIARCIRRWFA